MQENFRDFSARIPSESTNFTPQIFKMARAIEKGGQSPPAQLEPKSKFSKRDLYYFRVNASFNVSIYEGRNQSSSWKKHENLFHPRKGFLVLFPYCPPPPPSGARAQSYGKMSIKTRFPWLQREARAPSAPPPGLQASSSKRMIELKLIKMPHVTNLFSSGLD